MKSIAVVAVTPEPFPLNVLERKSDDNAVTGTLPHSESSTSSPRNVHLLRSYEDIAVRNVGGDDLILPISGKSWEEELEFDNYLLFYSLSNSSLAKLKDVKKALPGWTHLVLCGPGGKFSKRKIAAIARALTTKLDNNSIYPTYVKIKYTTNNEFKMKIERHGEYFGILEVMCQHACCPCFVGSRCFDNWWYGHW